MLKSIELTRLLVRLARASKPTYYEVGPSYHQELDIANGLGSARLIGSGKNRRILFNPYSQSKPMVIIPLRKAVELNKAKTFTEILRLGE